MASSILVSVLTLLLVISSACNVESLQSNFYRKSCPKAEATIKRIVTKAVNKDKRVGAGMLRLFFHDCFVEGCDASILIDSPTNQAEKDAIPNQTLHSLELIDQAKAVVEKLCKKTVSCADIIAFAASASLAALGGLNVDVLGGRFDGKVSSITEANQQIPSPFETLSQLQSSFRSKGLNTNDLVTLSGAHTVGKAHCGAFSSRLLNFSSTAKVDPSLNSKLAKSLQKQCPVNPPSTTVVNNDVLTPTFFDNGYHQDVRTKRGLFTSDAQLYTSASTRNIVDGYARNNVNFLNKFGAALVKMGKIGVKRKGPNGNVRTNCRSFS